MEGLPALILWDQVLAVLSPSVAHGTTQGSSTPSASTKYSDTIQSMFDTIDYTPPALSDPVAMQTVVSIISFMALLASREHLQRLATHRRHYWMQVRIKASLELQHCRVQIRIYGAQRALNIRPLLLVWGPWLIIGHENAIVCCDLDFWPMGKIL